LTFKIGGELDDIRKVLSVNFSEAIAPEEMTERIFSIFNFLKTINRGKYSCFGFGNFS